MHGEPSVPQLCDMLLCAEHAHTLTFLFQPRLALRISLARRTRVESLLRHSTHFGEDGTSLKSVS